MLLPAVDELVLEANDNEKTKTKTKSRMKAKKTDKPLENSRIDSGVNWSHSPARFVRPIGLIRSRAAMFQSTK